MHSERLKVLSLEVLPAATFLNEVSVSCATQLSTPV